VREKDGCGTLKQQKPETAPERDDESKASKIPFHEEGAVLGFLRN
jgi:hypothetical protein